MAGKKDDKWIQGAVKHPGSFRAKAERAGALTQRGTIKQSFIDKSLHSTNSTTRKQAQLAKTLGKMH